MSSTCLIEENPLKALKSSIAIPLVHTEETSGHQKLPDSYRRYKLLDLQDEFDRTWELYFEDQSEKGQKRLNNLENCGSQAYFSRNCKTGDIRIVSHTCRLRWCPICAKSKSAWIGKVVSEWLKKQAHPKMVTFTIKHREMPLRTQIDFLYDAFKKLRRHKFFKKTLTGGVWFFQVKRSKTDGMWHPHLHCLVGGSFISKPELIEAWQSVTGGSYIIDIRGVFNPDRAADHVARYAARPAALSNLSLNSAIECMEALHGRRLCGVWGTAKEIKLTPPKLDDHSDWRNIGAWSTVINLKNTDENARKIFKAWKTGDPLERDINMDHVEGEQAFQKWILKEKQKPPNFQKVLDWFCPK